MKIKAYYLLLFCLSLSFCQAQNKQIIFQLAEGESIQQLNASNKINTYRQLSKSLNIWLIETSSTQTKQKKESTLSNLKKQPQIKAAQFNEKVELRNEPQIPNDFWLSEQWQYNNKSQNFGVTDADVDALLIKDFILQGTNPIADLYRRSVSNGRLNLFNSFCNSPKTKIFQIHQIP